LKASFATKIAGLPALADDSGIEFSALADWPGVETAREIDRLGGWHVALNTLYARLGPGGRVRYTSALALAWPDGRVANGIGSLEGELIWPLQGEGGAPFDRAFRPDGVTTTLGQLAAETRAASNPRAIALCALERALNPERAT
jgi:XTP/dITP diphosphohydrolase